MQSSAVSATNQAIRPSFYFCQEKCACPEPNTLASLYCVTCSSFQCQSCFHRTHQKQCHPYRALPNIPLILLCEGQLCKKNLPSPNFADFVCSDCCNQRFCLDCEQTVHKGALVRHQSRIPFADYLRTKQQSQQQEKVDTDKKNCQEETNPITTDSPYESEDESAGEFHSFASDNFTSIGSSGTQSQNFLQSFFQLEPELQKVSRQDFFQSFAVYSQRTALPDSIDSPTTQQFESCNTPEEMSGSNNPNTAQPVPRARCRQSPSTPPNNTSRPNGTENGHPVMQAVQLMDDSEDIKIETGEELSEILGCNSYQEFHVVSIIGNTGDGKSHTLNQTFFDGAEVFQVSDSPNPCTIGVYAAISDSYLLLDTEGLLGKTHKNNQRTRMLLKILAVSDVTIYRTKAERMHSDLFEFLYDAGIAYKDFMLPALMDVTQSKTNTSPENDETSQNRRSSKDNIIPCKLLYQYAPSIIVFHETQHVKPFSHKVWREELSRRLWKDGVADQVFNRIDYISAGGEQISGVNVDTRYEDLRKQINTALDGQSDVRRPRKLSVFMEHFVQLNKRYGGEIIEMPKLTFPEQYFTCPMTCRVCTVRCKLTLNHKGSHEARNGDECKQSPSIDNKVYYCRRCSKEQKKGRAIWIPAPRDSSLVSAAFSYMWNGSTLQCELCGPLLYSREQWFSPTNPELSNKVDVKYDHIFDKDRGGRQDTCHAFQRVLDNFNVLSTHVGGMGETITGFANPDYWEPNEKIIFCAACNANFAEMGLKKHHCRMCGKGVCDPCSTERMPVEERGFLEKVRVCNKCKEKPRSNSIGTPDGKVSARKAVEVTTDTLGILGKVVQIPAVLAKEYARPSYWQPDSECFQCHVCSGNFTSLGIAVHHCRSCGYGVCGKCSKQKSIVPERGYLDHPVRVCNHCFTLLRSEKSVSRS